MSALVLERELDRLEPLWDEGLADCYHSYLEAADDVDVDMRQRLALAAALVEVGIRLQGLGGPAAPAPALLIGDLCLARSSRILTDSASRAVQVAFARAVEKLSSAAASNAEAPNIRELLTRAVAAR